MKIKQIKIFLYLIVGIVVVIGIGINDDLTGWLQALNSQEIAAVDNGELSAQTNDKNEVDVAGKELQVTFLDVGQGDAILITTPQNKKILIDGGPDNTVLNSLSKKIDFYDNKIDIMILTHPHDDHVVGLIEVLRRYQVDKIYYTGVVHTTDDYLTWLNEINRQKIDLSIVDQPFTLNLAENLNLEFLYPQASFVNQRVEELNNTSIVNRLVYNDIEFLFMGDAEFEVEQELLSASIDLTADVLKVGHHGSSSSSSEEFLTAVSPEFAIIMCGQDNEYGHPHLITLRRLERLGINYFRVDQDGSIECLSNGKKVDCQASF